MSILVISQEEVRRLLPIGTCIELMAGALATLGKGEGLNPLRAALLLPEGAGLLGWMPSYLESPAAVGIKVISVFPADGVEAKPAAGAEDSGAAHPSHQGAVLLFEIENGTLLAVIEASEITAIRTAAVSGLATRLLAREDAEQLAILGCGVQARSHLEAMLAVRPVSNVRVWSRTRSRAETFAVHEAARHGVTITAVESAEEAVREAELICTATASTHPVLRGEWLADGAHVNAVGSSVSFARELDTPAVVRSRLFVDRRESTLNEAGDFLFPQKEGAIAEDHIQGELGEILLGQCEGRRSATEVTLFKSLGLGVEDLAAAHHVYTQALATGAGTRAPYTL